MIRRGTRAWFIAAVALVTGGCEKEDLFPTQDELDNQLNNLRPVRSFRNEDPTNGLFAATASSPEKRALAESFGDKLFHDTALGPCNVSCASCHVAPSYADPDKPFSQGCGTTTRNTPSLTNLRYGRFFFWDGRADSVWAQAIGPLLHPDEIGATPQSVRARIVGDAAPGGYAASYEALFGSNPANDADERVVSNVGKAIQLYLWTDKFVALDSEFDRGLAEFVSLSRQAIASGLDEDQKKVEALPLFLGLKTYTRKGGCILCHRDSLFADESFHNIGVAQVGQGRFDTGLASGFPQLEQSPYNAQGSWSDDPSKGALRLDSLRGLAHSDQGRGAFKTPSLRNIALSAPYMHNGSLATLRDVIEFYVRGGDPAGTYPGPKADTLKPLDLSDEEKDALVQLLESMTSEPTAP